MYRIEVTTGEETVFRTVEELATGIRNGLITPRCRIYHAASQKWLPIEFHPHYKKAVELVTGGAPVIDTGPVRPTPAASRRMPSPAKPPPPAPVLTPAPVAPSEPLPPREIARPVRPTPMPWESPAPADEPVTVATPVVEQSPAEVQLPKISYPEVPPPTDAEAPHPVARRRAPSGAPRVLGGIVVLLMLGGWLVMRSGAPAPAAAPVIQQPAPASESEFGNEPAFPEEVPTESPAPSPVPLPAPHQPAKGRVSPATTASVSAPRPLRSLPTSTQRPTGPVSQAWSSSAGAIAAPAPATSAPVAAPAPEVTAITPLPAELDLSVGKLPRADSLAAGVPSRDSAAISRILKAVSGTPASKKRR